MADQMKSFGDGYYHHQETQSDRDWAARRDEAAFEHKYGFFCPAYLIDAVQRFLRGNEFAASWVTRPGWPEELPGDPVDRSAIALLERQPGGWRVVRTCEGEFKTTRTYKQYVLVGVTVSRQRPYAVRRASGATAE